MTICSSRFSFWCLLLTLCLPKLAARCHRARGAPGLSLFKSNQLGSFFELLAGALTPMWPPISDNPKSRGSTQLFNVCSRPRPLSLGVTKHVLTMFLAGQMPHRAPEDQTRKSELTACVGWREGDFFHRQKLSRVHFCITLWIWIYSVVLLVK